MSTAHPTPAEAAARPSPRAHPSDEATTSPGDPSHAGPALPRPLGITSAFASRDRRPSASSLRSRGRAVAPLPGRSMSSRTPLPCFRHDSDFRLLGSMKAPRLGDSVNASNRKLHLTEEHPCPTCRGGVFKRTVGVARASSLAAPAAAGSLGSLPTRTRR
jgi:hypothetical protein